MANAFSDPMRKFTRPLPVAAVLLLVVNDHVLKGSRLVPSVLTGKISDFAGLFFFPILFACLLRAILEARPGAAPRTEARGRLPEVAVLLTGLVFVTLKLSPSASAWASRFWGVVVPDPTDLVALPSLALAYLYMRRGLPLRTADHTPSSAGGTLVERTGLLLAALAALATSQPPRPFTTWQTVSTNSRAAGCARIDLWVSKSGKEGVGISLAVRFPQAPCDVRLTRAALRVGSKTFAPLALPGTLSAEAPAYIPFVFDNEALWNEGQRGGELEVEVVAAGERVVLVVPMAHVWDDERRRHSMLGGPKVLYLAVDPRDGGVMDAGDVPQ